MIKDKKPKNLPILEHLIITDAGSEGQAVARVNDLVVFVEQAVPGDIVDVQITRKKHNYREGKVIRYHQYSEYRATPACQHFGVCGGCKWQHMSYERQLFYKQKQVYNCLTRIGKLTIPEIAPIIPSEEVYYYRNKLDFSFSNKKWLTEAEIQNKNLAFGDTPGAITRNALGFHKPGLFDKVIDIEHCHLQRDPSNAIRLELKRFALEQHLEFFDLREQTGLLRNVIIRTSSNGQLMVIVVFHRNDPESRNLVLNHLHKQFPEITSLMYVINPKRNDTIADLEVHLFKGQDFITEEMPAYGQENKILTFKIGPQSFYQTNSRQAHRLYKAAADLAKIQPHEIVYDLYTGTGTIAGFIAHSAKKVVGMEYIAPAIEDAKLNAQLNGQTNTFFVAGDIKDILTNEFVNENGKPDVIITDPPRTGMHPDVVNKLLELWPSRIVYISCNPATQARDLALMQHKYKATAVQPVDMFPHTHHVENIVLLELI